MIHSDRGQCVGRQGRGRAREQRRREHKGKGRARGGGGGGGWGLRGGTLGVGGGAELVVATSQGLQLPTA